jgi:hypothetical protein
MPARARALTHGPNVVGDELHHFASNFNDSGQKTFKEGVIAQGVDDPRRDP